jgi:hypothetical protein
LAVVNDRCASSFRTRARDWIAGQVSEIRV